MTKATVKNQTIWGAPHTQISSNLRALFKRSPTVFHQTQVANETLEPLAREPEVSTRAPWNDTATDDQESVSDGQPVVGAGLLAVNGLADQREALGERYAHFQARVQEAVETVFRTRMTEEDRFKDQGNHRFLLILPNASGYDARARVSLIAKEIEARLQNYDEIASFISVDRFVVDVERHLVGRGEFDFGAVSALFEQANRSRDEAVTPPVAIDSERADETPSDGASPKSGMRSLHRSPSFLDAVQAQFLYWPVWNVRSNALLAFLPERLTDRVFDRLEETDDPARTLELDFASLYDIACNYERLEVEDKRFPVICPVHFATLASSRVRREYLAFCEALPKCWRSFLTYEVISAPSDVTPIRVQAIVRSLKPLGRGVYWRADLQAPHLPDLEYTGIDALGQKLDESLADESEMMKCLDAFARKMKGLRIETFLHGVPSRSLAINAFCANFSYISGEAVHAKVDRLDHLRSFEPGHLLFTRRSR